ncbi:MAG: hypothetical protein HQK93_08935, partial [Nitrospirae bacterium]|nr:hypothetical protein [Nitrospirota bacterium]
MDRINQITDQKFNIEEMYASELQSLKPYGNNKAKALCPFHKDTSASFLVDLIKGNYRCLGCGVKCNVLDFYNKKKLKGYTNIKETPTKEAEVQTKGNNRIVASYDYKDEDGRLLYQIVRYNPKKFAIRRPNGDNGWVYNAKGLKMILYNLPKVILSNNIIVVEGEKDVDSLNLIGLTATSNPFGAGVWKAGYNKYFKDKDVVIIPDNDDPGRKHALVVANNIKGVATSIKIVTLSEVPEKGDISDWLSQGGTKDKLLDLIQCTEIWHPQNIDKPQIKPIIKHLIADEDISDLNVEIEESEDTTEPLYFVDEDGCLCRWKDTKIGRIKVILANFDAYISEEVEEDDGLTKTFKFAIEGKTLNSQFPTIEITASTFANMGWVFQWGNKAILSPGMFIKDYVRHAIQIKSEPKRTTIFTHTGWRNINNKWVYLSYNGAIGAENISVRLSKE